MFVWFGNLFPRTKMFSSTLQKVELQLKVCFRIEMKSLNFVETLASNLFRVNDVCLFGNLLHRTKMFVLIECDITHSEVLRCTSREELLNFGVMASMQSTDVV